MKINLRFLSNPITKTVASQVGGLLLGSVDTFIQGPPTGGLNTYLLTHPIAIPLYSIGVGLVHNMISRSYPPAPAGTQVMVQPAPTESQSAVPKV